MDTKGKRVLACLLLLAGLAAVLLPAARTNRREAVEETAQGAKMPAKDVPAGEDKQAPFTVYDLQIDASTNPVGIDHEDVAFSWKLQSAGEELLSCRQNAYQIRVYRKGYDGSESCIWDSGIVYGKEQFGIRCKGELEDFTRYEWQVWAYDEAGNYVASDRGSFVTGYLHSEPFGNASMITMDETENVYYEGMPIYFRDISLPEEGIKEEKIAAAYLCISALGQYEAWMNGERIGDAEFAPGWTDYHDRLLYRVMDVTEQLRGKESLRLAVSLGTGWWAGRNGFGTYDYHRPAWIAELVLVDINGSRTVIPTDESWYYRKDTAVRDADFFNGESMDFSRPDVKMMSEPKEQQKENRENTAAKQVSVSHDFEGSYTAYYGPEVKHIPERDREPQEVVIYEGTEDNGSDYGRIHVIDRGQAFLQEDESPVLLKKGQTLIADLGQNMTGVPQVTLSGSKDCEATLLFAEMLNTSGEKEKGNDGPEGSLYRASYRSAATTVKLTLADEEKITYRPAFFYTGFRYLSLTATEDVKVYGMRGLFIGNSSPETGSIETDQKDINRLYENVRWSQFNNFMLVATDCPQRDERLGWMGDLGSFTATALYNADLRSFYDKWAEDLMDAQTPEGAFTDTVPATVHTGAGNGGWADAGILIPLEVYRRYGDASYLKRLYPALKQYMSYLENNSDFGKAIGPGNIYGDWLAAEKTDADFLCAMWYGADAAAMQQIAGVLGEKEDAKSYGKLLAKIKSFIAERYVNQRESFSQTELLFLLHYNLLDQKARYSEENLREMLAKSVVVNGYKVMTGFAGTPMLLPTLSEMGRNDLAYRILLGRENPSWMYSLDQGATTIWERYDSYTRENGFQDAAMNSFDHFNEGSVAQWMYEEMVGIKVDHTRQVPVRIMPALPDYGDETLTEEEKEMLPRKVKGSYDSVYGRISVSWEYREGKAFFEIEIPATATAAVKLPIEEGKEKLLEGGRYFFEGKLPADNG